MNASPFIIGYFFSSTALLQKCPQFLEGLCKDKDLSRNTWASCTLYGTYTQKSWMRRVPQTRWDVMKQSLHKNMSKFTGQTFSVHSVYYKAPKYTKI